MNDEKLKSNSIDPFMLFLIIHNSSFIILFKAPPQKLFIRFYSLGAAGFCQLKSRNRSKNWHFFSLMGKIFRQSKKETYSNDNNQASWDCLYY